MNLDFFTPLVSQYGLFGLFLTALVGSTIFVPFYVEAAILVLVEIRVDLYLIVIVAAIGALIGTCINYAIGRFASKFAEKTIGESTILKAKKAMDKYGWPGLFFIVAIPIPLPIPVDPITIIPGLTRMKFPEFVIVIFLAKLVRYSLFVGLFQGVLGLMGFL
jgi:membrane protein YqaA with SNARE-associated domain